MSGVENASVDWRILCDAELDAVTGGDSKPGRGARFTVKLYTEQVKFTLHDVDA
jgi:hypothetical protein